MAAGPTLVQLWVNIQQFLTFWKTSCDLAFEILICAIAAILFKARINKKSDIAASKPIGLVSSNRFSAGPILYVDKKNRTDAYDYVTNMI